MIVVFLPYCASMWDSLAEYYYEYKDIAETYVIPIPYYGKRKDGSFDKLYYDGDKFPSDVIITDYMSVDLKKLHPDIIFIHNAYDNINLVTSVEPSYYSNKLIEYTDCLIYVPYFTSCYVDRHFINIPGAKNAHKIIVETEEQRQMYISILGSKNIEVRESSKKLYLKDRIVDVPSDWKLRINNKTVVFFNTSLTSLLDNTRIYLPKLKKDLMMFQQQNDKVLLWRPHPLFRHTIIALVPYLLDSYDSIVSWYKSENFGIFDDSSDLQRAIILSDEYYGDISSVTVLFEELNKPIKIR